MRPSEALARHRDEVKAIIARYPVSNPRVFGSVARGEDREESDIDILVEPEFGVTTFADLIELEHELSRLLDFNIDILTPGGFSASMAERVQRDAREL